MVGALPLIPKELAYDFVKSLLTTPFLDDLGCPTFKYYALFGISNVGASPGEISYSLGEKKLLNSYKSFLSPEFPHYIALSYRLSGSGVLVWKAFLLNTSGVSHDGSTEAKFLSLFQAV